MPTVRAIDAFVAITDAGVVPVLKDQAFDSKDPIVKGREHLFAADNAEDRQRRSRTRGGVEQATANPGEFREL